MSWSVSAIGKPAAVKIALAKQFESAKNSTKNMPHENESVGAIETIVNGELDFLAARTNPLAVQVTGSGSAYYSSDGTGSTQLQFEVKPIHGFVE
jgi:hypothetical protein